LVDTPQSQPAPHPADTVSLPGGYRLLEYRIERALGGGGFGITYLAKDANLDLPVAIKEYFPADAAVRGANHRVQVRSDHSDLRELYQWGLERFLDEARALATFRHPNIVRVLRYFRENDTAYIVMEYESGDPLKRWLPLNAPLGQGAVLSVILPLLDGLDAVHRTGFLHRDIKPDNIYVRADGTPVLLDFGAARRVTANQDMTNIVSPGFAPFEQYHSQGHQGPWTDIYSLGAVMYWMTTGRKPIESASRVKTDGMLPATNLGDASVFGLPMLQAIDWALCPDESRRPQSVDQFRAALLAAPVLDAGSTRTVPADRLSGVAAERLHGSTISSPLSGATTPSGSQRKNLLCTIMFLDLVGYSIRSVDDQVAIKKLLNELINKALRGVDESGRIAIDTGDGAAICFLGDPEEALTSAMLLRDLLGQRYGDHLSMRVGLHMGPVRVISDINERVNVVGDGINVAQRVMDFAKPNQVLVSRSYYDVVSRITDDKAGLFEYLGQFNDKHGRPHEIYTVHPAAEAATHREGPSTGYTQTVPAKPFEPLPANSVAEVESELARLIGPLAKVLVRKASPLARDIMGLREALGPSIQDAGLREAFVNGLQGGNPTQPGSGLLASRPFSRPASSGGATSKPSGTLRNEGSTSVPASGAFSRSSPADRHHHSTRQVDISPDELIALEHTLGKFIGPMARVLLRKEGATATGFRSLVTALASHIDHPQQREAFLQSVKRSLPNR
jgi:serine/threonine protein kinase